MRALKILALLAAFALIPSGVSLAAAQKAPAPISKKKPPKKPGKKPNKKPNNKPGKKPRPKPKPKPKPTVIKNGGAFPAPNAPADLGVPCAGADTVPSAANLDVVREAVLCLINKERAKEGIGALKNNGTLLAVGNAYSQLMVAQDHYDHTGPDGSSPEDRVLAQNYVAPAGNYHVGENLGVAEGALGAPRSIVAAWMASPLHRANIMNATFQESGVGVTMGVPASDSTGNPIGVTYVHMFGVRGMDIITKPTGPSISLG